MKEKIAVFWQKLGVLLKQDWKCFQSYAAIINEIWMLIGQTIKTEISFLWTDQWFMDIHTDQTNHSYAGHALTGYSNAD